MSILRFMFRDMGWYRIETVRTQSTKKKITDKVVYGPFPTKSLAEVIPINDEPKLFKLESSRVIWRIIRPI